MMRRRILSCFLVLCGLLAILGIGYSAARPTKAFSDNLLVNGNFDELPFYWAYPNHFVAGGWDRWWIHGTVLPEYDDVKGVRELIYVDGGHAQVYFKWGNNYTAGIFQVVNGLTPCRPYKLTMYARTHTLEGARPGTRIGLDPVGAQLTPDGAVHDPTPLYRTVWSREQTALRTWEELSVTAEPLGNSLTAILYASPVPGSDAVHYYDTFWDAGALRPASYSDGRLPGPIQPTTSFIQNVTPMTSPTSLTINWSLADTAGTQVWYSTFTPAPPVPITSTFLINYPAYLPVVQRNPLNFAHYTTLDYTTNATHSATITDLSADQTVYYVIVARRSRGDACVTEYAGPYTIHMQP